MTPPEPGGPGRRTIRERYRFLASARWIGLMGFAVVASLVCVLLGMWQWSRYEMKADRLETLDANWDAPATTLEDVLTRGLAIGLTDEWRRVHLTGEFLPGSSVSIRNRPVASQPALLPTGLFLAERPGGGDVLVVVSRGWIPADDAVPELPAGELELEVRMRIEEPDSGREAPPGQAYSFNAAEIVRSAGLTDVAESLPMLAGWAESVQVEQPLGPLPEPERSLGSHLSYAFQWWFFAAAIPVGVIILARREAMDEFAMAVAGIGAPRRSGPTDEDIEDLLVEAQLAEEPGPAAGRRAPAGPGPAAEREPAAGPGPDPTTDPAASAREPQASDTSSR